jgi:hypothetical protein
VGLISSGAGSGPGDISSAWDAFFHDWVKPVVHFGTPALIVFAVLLTLTRVLTGVLVTKDSPGVRSSKTVARLPVSVMYWFGVFCLLWASIEATVIFPFARNLIGHHKPSAPPAPWTAESSVAMAAVAGVVVWVLYCIVGRPLRRKVYAPGLNKQQRKERGLQSYARIGWTIPVTAGMAVGAAAVIVGLIGLSWWHFHWLDGRVSPGAYAPLLAALGVVIVGRTRGIGMGLVMQGHDKNGGDDAGLGASVRARLYTLGSHGPAGIQVTQQTDVSTLPQEALSLIPDGTLSKLAALFVSLFAPATPWRADVTEQSDGSIVVSILRNGVAADAVVIRASTLWLPDKNVNDAGTASIADDTGPAASGSAQGSSPGGPGTAADWTVELRTAAAAFILLTLSRRYYHLEAGLSGAKDWRSVAMQVIATDPACHLTEDDKRALLANAVAEDGGNMAAQLAFLNASYRTTADQRENRLFAEKLYSLLDKMPNDEGMWPLRLRLRFNLLACLLNEAASFERRYDRPLPQSKDVPEVRDVLCKAAKQAGRLVVFWRNSENQRTLPDLWDDMDVAVTTAAEAVQMEWKRRFRDAMEVSWKEEDRDRSDRKKAKMTLLARYQKVCLLVGRAALLAGQQQLDRYAEALDELEMVTAVKYFRSWARADPSLTELHDVDTMTKLLLTPAAGAHGEPNAPDVAAMKAAEYVGRFKRLTGEPCPADFLALAPFAKCRPEIEKRGIHTAADLGQEAAATLVSELGITNGVAKRWLGVARLYTWLREVPPASGLANDAADPDTITTALVFLLMQANLDSVPALRRELWQDGGSALGQFRTRLLDRAQSWAIVVPAGDDISYWQQELTCSDAHPEPGSAHTGSMALPHGNSRGAVRLSWLRSWF